MKVPGADGCQEDLQVPTDPMQFQILAISHGHDHDHDLADSFVLPCCRAMQIYIDMSHQWSLEHADLQADSGPFSVHAEQSALLEVCFDLVGS